MAIERVMRLWGVASHDVGPFRRGRGRVAKAEVIVAQALTWMNQQGPLVKVLLEELQIAPKDLIVVHDDLDLAIGRLRLRRDGGSGGHNGIRSILTSLETNEFSRLKIGVGRPAPGEDAADYVLSVFAPEEIPVVEATLERAVQALECLVVEGMAAAMNRFNIRAQELN
jgi:PTH1 family peptidyl-tRNA hydrolase